VTTKNSGARNLHRLRTAILFIQQLFQRLVNDADVTLATAASAAYAETLSPYHTALIRGTVTTGFAILPSRATFLSNIRETGVLRHLKRTPPEETGCACARVNHIRYYHTVICGDASHRLVHDQPDLTWLS
jgi:hypothetical protein